MPQTRQAQVAVVGGGFTGMVCALTLLQAGYAVTILEAQQALGGLTAPFHYGSFTWDRFYHCILTSDHDLLNLLRGLGLEQELRWTATEVGFFSHGRLHTMTSPRDLLRFPHLSLAGKARLALGTWFVSHMQARAALDSTPLLPWTRRIFGARVTEEIWEPLLRCKLGEMRHQASAAFLWSTLRRLYSTREHGPEKQERLGYVHGGYAAIFQRLRERVQQLGAEIRTGVSIRRIAGEDGRVHIVESGGHSRMFDACMLTVSNRAVAACLHTADGAYLQRLGSVRYLGIVAVVLVLRRALGPYYVTNITDQVPFTGVIEMTNLIDKDAETAGLHLVYLPRYTAPGDPLLAAGDDEVWQRFAPALRCMYPHLVDEDIVSRHIFRERTVQPVPTLGYAQAAPPVHTPVPRVYLANTAQIVHNTLNNNVMTGIAQRACAQLMRELPASLIPGPQSAIAPMEVAACISA